MSSGTAHDRVMQTTSQIRFPWNRDVQELAIPESTQCFVGGEIPALHDIAMEVVTALSNPIEFPPLDMALVPGDEIVVTIEPGIPALPELLMGIKRYLTSSFRVPSKVTILLSENEADLTATLAASVAPWGVHVHHPNAQKQRAYLAASTGADPIYVNRILADADFILPCRLERSESSHHSNGIFGIAPYFVDVATQERFARAALQGTDGSSSSVQIANEVGVLLGIQFVLSVVPNSDVHIGRVFAGDPKACHVAANDARLRNFPTLNERKFDLVVALVDGDPIQQSWENIVRATVAAEQLATKNGGIVVACSMAHIPQELLRTDHESEGRFIDVNAEPTNSSEFKASRHTMERIRRSRPMYLLSNLPAEDTERLGFCHVDSWREVEHLLRSHARSVILGNAQYR